MKKIVLSIGIMLFALFFSSKIQAQEIFKWMPKDVIERSEIVTSIMVDRLELDELQIEKLQKINLKYAGLMQPILESDSSPLEKFKQAEEIILNRIAETKAILNENQLTSIENRMIRWKPLVETLLQKLLD